jgi:hypothetical protein
MDDDAMFAFRAGIYVFVSIPTGIFMVRILLRSTASKNIFCSSTTKIPENLSNSE